MNNGWAEDFFSSIKHTAGFAGIAAKNSWSRTGSKSTAASRVNTSSGYYALESYTAQRASRTQRPGGNDQTLNLAGAFVNFGDARVAVSPLDGIFAAVTVATVNLNCFVRNACGHFTCEELRHGGVHA